MSLELLTGGFYKNSVKQDDIVSANKSTPRVIRQMGQTQALNGIDQFVIRIPSVFLVGMRMANTPEDIYQVGEEGSLVRVFVENVAPSRDGGTDITLTFDR